MTSMIKKLNKKNKALFLDRDGVINEDYGYVYQVQKFHLIENIKILIKEANLSGYKIIIITNQAGIGKNLYTNNDFKKLTKYMKDLFIKDGCYVDAVYHCPYHPTQGIGRYLKNSYDRKPNPGMLLKAQKDFNLDMSKSILIGDKISDIEAGNNAFINNNILFSKNKNKNKNKNKKSHSFIEINCLTEALDFL